MWQSKRKISRECNDIIGSAKGSQISETYWGEVGKGKRADIYLEVRKRRGHIFFNGTSACAYIHGSKVFVALKYFPIKFHLEPFILKKSPVVISYLIILNNINYLFSNLTEQFLTNYYSYFFCVLQCFRKVCRYELYALKLPLGGI